MSWESSSLSIADNRVTDGNGDLLKFNLDAQRNAYAQYLMDILLMQQQYSYDDTWWNEHDSPNAVTSQLKSLGYSDAFISKVLSGGSSSQNGQAPFVSASGTNPLQDIASLSGAISDSANSVSQAVQADTAAQVGQAQVENLKSQAYKNNVDAGLAPGLAASQNTKNYSSAAKDDSDVVRNDVLNDFTREEIREIGKKIDLTEEQITNYKLQNYWYNDITIAELNESQARCQEYFSRTALNYANVKVAESEVDLNTELAAESQQRQYKTYVEAQNIAQDTKNKDLSYQQAKYEFDYMVAHEGIKLDMDTQQKVGELIARGKLDEAEKYLMGQYRWQLYCKSGDVMGNWFVPSDGYDESNDRSKMRINIPKFTFDLFDSLPVHFGFGSYSNMGGRPLPSSTPNPSGGKKPYVSPTVSSYSPRPANTNPWSTKFDSDAYQRYVKSKIRYGN